MKDATYDRPVITATSTYRPIFISVLARAFGGDGLTCRTAMEEERRFGQDDRVESLTVTGGPGGATIHYTLLDGVSGERFRKAFRVFRNCSVKNVAKVLWNLFNTREALVALDGDTPIFHRDDRSQFPRMAQVGEGDAIALIDTELNRMAYTITLGRHALTVGDYDSLTVGW